MRKNKSKGIVQKSRKEIAILLKNGDDEKARIIAEQTIKEEDLNKALEELQGISEELLARIGVISSSKRLPMDLKEQICTIIWATSRLDIKEFGLMRVQFALRFGANLDHEALCNIANCVSQYIIDLMSANPPSEDQVFEYLKAVAAEFDIDWGFHVDDAGDLDFNDLDNNSSMLADIYGFDTSSSSVLPSSSQAQSTTKESSSSSSISLTKQELPSNSNPHDDIDEFEFSSFEQFKQIQEHGQAASASASQKGPLDDLDEFERMFAPIPDNGVSLSVLKTSSGSFSSNSSNSSSQIQKISSVQPQRLSNSNVQRVTPVVSTNQPQKVSSTPTKQQIHSNPSNPSNPSPSPSPVLSPSPTASPYSSFGSSSNKQDFRSQMSKELVEMSDKDLEAEFEQLFNCSYRDDDNNEPMDDDHNRNSKQNPELSSKQSQSSVPKQTTTKNTQETSVPSSFINLSKHDDPQNSNSSQIQKNNNNTPTAVNTTTTTGTSNNNLALADFECEEIIVESTGESNEYMDLFSAPNPVDGPNATNNMNPELWNENSFDFDNSVANTDNYNFDFEGNQSNSLDDKETNDYDDIFARLSAVTSDHNNSNQLQSLNNTNTNTTTATASNSNPSSTFDFDFYEENNANDNGMTEEEWAARFNTGAPDTFDFASMDNDYNNNINNNNNSTTVAINLDKEEPAPAEIEDDIFARFRAL